MLWWDLTGTLDLYWSTDTSIVTVTVRIPDGRARTHARHWVPSETAANWNQQSENDSAPYQ